MKLLLITPIFLLFFFTLTFSQNDPIYSIIDYNLQSADNVQLHSREQISFGKQISYGIIAGVVSAVGTWALVVPKCGGLVCSDGAVISFIAVEAGFLTGNTIGVILGSNNKLNTWGKFSAFVGSFTGFLISLAITTAMPDNNIAGSALVSSNIILPPLISAFFSRSGVISDSYTTNYSSKKHNLNLPDLQIGLNGLSNSKTSDLKLKLQTRIFSF